MPVRMQGFLKLQIVHKFLARERHPIRQGYEIRFLLFSAVALRISYFHVNKVQIVPSKSEILYREKVKKNPYFMLISDLRENTRKKRGKKDNCKKSFPKIPSH